jgi:transcriptional regulator with GAF, ATPase, and Fis domain
MTPAPNLATVLSHSGRDTSAPEVRRVLSLLEISQALSGRLKPKSAAHHVLEILTRHHGAIQGTVTLLQENGELAVEACDGLHQPEAPLMDRVGEGITGRVVETGRPVVVPRASGQPVPFNRECKRPELAEQERSVICVPIMLDHKAIGALSISLKFKQDRDYDRTSTFLGVVALMLAQAIKIQRLIEEDRQRLEAENRHLRQELENVLEQAVLACNGQVVQVHHLPPTLQTEETSDTVTRMSLSDAMKAYESDLIQDALRTARGNRAKAARLLETTGRILNYRVKQLGIDYVRFKTDVV